MEAPEVDACGVTFSFRETGDCLKAVSLVQEVAVPRTGPSFARSPDFCWTLRFDRPPVRRFEYRFELAYLDGHHETICDPLNPRRAPGAFGERSVVEFPDYRPPAFAGAEPPAGSVVELALPSPLLGGDQPAMIWSARGAEATARLPVLVVLDGIEFARYSGLVRMLDWAVATRRLPSMRALLLHPTARNDHYSANPVLADAIADELLPAAGSVVPLAGDRRLRAALGASLGGLALLHAVRRHPELFGALFLQSATFVRRGHLSGMEYAERIEDCFEEILGAPAWDRPIPVEMTCGAVETALSGNRQARTALRRQGCEAHLHVMADAHNWIGWRDAWQPHLSALLRKAWR